MAWVELFIGGSLGPALPSSSTPPQAALPEDPDDVAGLREHLAMWFRAQARDLPWREPRFREDPYAVLVSEIMLQQTRVDTVVPYFLAWMEQWPTVEDLAGASEEAVLEAWQGLGYYNRARRLHRAAQQVVEEHGGEMPGTVAGLRELPGVGPYTAAAIAAMAFDVPAVAVDGNVVRLWARLACQPVDPTDAKAKRRAREELAPLLPGDGGAGELVEALIELGATVCTPQDPDCPACPLAQGCTARAEGRVHEVPATAERRETPVREVVAVLVEDADGRVLLRKRPTDGLLGGLWGLPMVERGPREAVADAVARALAGAGADVEARPAARVSHAFTHKRWDVRVHRIDLAPDDLPGGEGWRWLGWGSMDRVPRARLDEKVLEALEQRRLDTFG